MVAPQALIELEAARAAVLDPITPLESEAVELARSLGRRVAGPVRSTDPVPAFDNSAMDGFAVRSADTTGARGERPVWLELAGESRAGHPSEAGLDPGQAMTISTGAVIPEGADSVVPLEDAVREKGRVGIGVDPPPGLHIRRPGEDVAPGSEVISSGTVIGPAEQGVLASVGAGSVSCYRRPRVAVLSSGDELIGPGDPMRPGAVRNSNSFSISGLVRESGAEVVLNEIVRDEPAATREAIGAAVAADLVVVCGGVSVGEHDHVKGALIDLGFEQRFWRIALKPGKPTWFGRRGETLAFGLPGNPVSAMVTFLLLARPALTALGGGLPDRRRIRARLAADRAQTPGRTEAVRCRIEPGEGGWTAEPTGAQGSHILTSMLGADGLVLVPPGEGTIEAGETVEVELIGHG